MKKVHILRLISGVALVGGLYASGVFAAITKQPKCDAAKSSYGYHAGYGYGYETNACDISTNNKNNPVSVGLSWGGPSHRSNISKESSKTVSETGETTSNTEDATNTPNVNIPGINGSSNGNNSKDDNVKGVNMKGLPGTGA